ncbi:MAG: hypothetical protein KBT68_03530, partial [bacterium]|nr:hypothetical protein [Candidatus Colisoma equi]
MKSGAAVVKKAIRRIWKTMKWSFIVFCVYLGSLFFREERLSGRWLDRVFDRCMPDGLILQVDSVSFGFRHGVHIRNLRLYDRTSRDALAPIVSADSIGYSPFFRRLRIEGFRYVRLPDSYYEEGNHERNERVECRFPDVGRLSVTLVRSDILGIRPEVLTFDTVVSPTRIDFEKMHLLWPDRDAKMGVDGTCYVDLDRQEIYGEVRGLARQAYIRPLLVAVDV